MKCKWMLRCALTVAIAQFAAAPTWGQYQDYSSSTQYGAVPPQRTQLPQWKPTLPLYEPTPPTQTTVSRPAPAPYGYSPSEMPSVNPFANMPSREQSVPFNYGNQQQQAAARYPSPAEYYPPATHSYGMYAVSADDPRQYAEGGGVLNSNPTQQIAPTPLSNSYYDQPSPSYAPQYDNGYDPKAGGCSPFVGPQGRTGWYGGVAALIMNRSQANNVWLSDDQTDIRDRVLNSNDAAFSTVGGVAATIGHYFNCGQNSIQFAYWGLYPGTSEANAYGAATAAGIDRILHFDALEYDAGAGNQNLGDTFFFNAERHRVQRSYQANNLELNLLGHNFTNGCSPLQLGWLAGVRYFRFDDNFLYSSDPNDTVFTGAPEEVHYAIDAQNNLLGFQIGGQANYCVGPRLGLFANTKVGVYGNHMSQTSRIYGSNGQAFVGDAASPYFGQDVYATASKNTYSMIGDLSIGANWCINPCWSINAGYRAVGLTGVALSTNQVPGDFIAALDSIRTVYPNGCVLLHGAFAGVNYCY